MPINSIKPGRYSQVKADKYNNGRFFVNGRMMDFNNDGDYFTVENAMAKLYADGVSARESPETSSNDTAMCLLSALGCTVSVGDPNFTLLSAQTDKETVGFGDLKYSKSESIVATDKFVNSFDPFYNLDDGPTYNQQIKRQNNYKQMTTPDIVSFTSEIVKINLNNSNGKLKQF